jgi:sulfonate transport system ATP-binding protein
MASGVSAQGGPAVTLTHPESSSQPATRGADIKVRGLAKSFDGKSVLRNISLDIPAGQFIAIVGRSGCGKTTLLRLLAGLEHPDSGEIALDGLAVAEAAAFTRVMFQEPRLLPWASVLANVRIGFGRDRETPEARRKAVEALARVGLGDRADEWPSVLSGGQRQRASLARALVSAPRILTLDEPLGALDALTRIEMQRLLEAVWRREGFTAVLVTHDVSEAVRLADRILLIEDGALALDIDVDLPRPREHGSVQVASLEEDILRRLIGGGENPPEFTI